MRGAARVALVAALAAGIGSTAWGHGPHPRWPRTEAFQLRFGAFFLEGGGELWDTNEELFTLEASDFDDFIFGLSWVHSFHNHFELGVNLDFYEETVLSHYRDFVDQRGFRIFHDTSLDLAPLSVDVRFLPGGRHRIRAKGRRILKPVFYVGGGIGTVFWEYEEVGDFLDFTEDPPEIFPARFQDDGNAFEIHALAGVELPFGRASSFLLEARYSKADDDLDDDFAGLGEIELGGTAVYGGLSFRF